jgi:hypothetical protein
MELDDTGFGGFETCNYRFSMDRWDIKECKKNPNPITFGPLISENTVAADKPHH